MIGFVLQPTCLPSEQYKLTIHKTVLACVFNNKCKYIYTYIYNLCMCVFVCLCLLVSVMSIDARVFGWRYGMSAFLLRTNPVLLSLALTVLGIVYLCSCIFLFYTMFASWKLKLPQVSFGGSYLVKLCCRVLWRENVSAFFPKST